MFGFSDVHPFGRGRLRQAELGPRLADHLQERLRRHGLRSVQTEPARCRRRAVGVYTVEQLVGISADGMAGIGMVAQDYVNVAQKFLAIVGPGPSLRETIGELRDFRYIIQIAANHSTAEVVKRREADGRMMQKLDGVTGQLAVGHEVLEANLATSRPCGRRAGSEAR